MTGHVPFAPWRGEDPPTAWRARVLLRDGNEELTYGAACEDAARWAAVLASAGAGPKRPVAAWGLSARDTIVLLLAAWRLQAPLAPLNHHVPPAGLDALRDVLGPCVLVTGEGLAPAMKDALMAGRAGKSRDESADPVLGIGHLRASARAPMPPPRPAPDALAWLIFTSGSTGRPKAVATRGEDVGAAVASAVSYYGLGADDVWFVPLPLFHVGGLMAVLRVMAVGGRAVFPGEGESWPALVRESRVTFASVVPTQLYRLADDPEAPAAFAALRAILVGGAACPPGLLARCAAWAWPLSLTYGASETTAQVAATPPGAWPKADEIRYDVMPGRQVAVREGRMAVTGPGIAAGYWRAGDILPARDADGWLLMEDRATLDAEGRRLRFLGRADAAFKVGGEMVSPADVESRLAAADFPGFWAMVPEPDPEYGALPALFVWASAAPDVEALAAWCRRELPGLWRPRHVYWAPTREGLPFKTSRALAAEWVADKEARLAQRTLQAWALVTKS